MPAAQKSNSRERGEVDIIGAYGLPGMLTSKPGWIDKGEAALIYQAAVKRNKLLPDVPTLPELASDEVGREVLFAVASTGDIGRSILTTHDSRRSARAAGRTRGGIPSDAS